MQQQEETPTRFSVPVIYDNPAGWGPTEESIPQKFLEIPYAPFSKGDKIGKVADFGGYNTKLYQRGRFFIFSPPLVFSSTLTCTHNRWAKG
jgi:hypothetical protein